MEFPNLQTLLKRPVYGLPREHRKKLFYDAMREVCSYHYANCLPYQKLCQKRKFSPEKAFELEDLPYLPTSLFKDTLLLSIPEEKVFREIQSSATTSGRPSKVGLDKDTNRRQSFCFNKTVLDRIGNKRFNFIVLDEPSTTGRSTKISARSSTIRSLLFCARDVQTCMKDENGVLNLDRDRLEELLNLASEAPQDVIIFGFTFVLYSYVIRPLLEAGKQYDLRGAKVLQIGGWKKLESQKVSPEKLSADCHRCFGVSKSDVIDLYGFTEQGGMIYPTCEAGLRHTPAWGDVIVRDQVTLEPLPPGKEGLIQFITPIQTSYPGHSVLTDDIGYIVGVDDCKCSRKGTTFKIVGRAEHSEIRGCGDIMAEKFA